MVARCTTKVLNLLGLRPSSLPELEPADDDWYLNLLWLERRKCLLLTHAATTFSVFVPNVRKADLNPLAPLLAEAITAALHTENLPPNALGQLDHRDIQITRTASRRVLGHMNDIALHIQYAHQRHGSLLDLDATALNRQLQRTLHNHRGQYADPLDLIAARTPRSATPRQLPEPYPLDQTSTGHPNLPSTPQQPRPTPG